MVRWYLAMTAHRTSRAEDATPPRSPPRARGAVAAAIGQGRLEAVVAGRRPRTAVTTRSAALDRAHPTPRRRLDDRCRARGRRAGRGRRRPSRSRHARPPETEIIEPVPTRPRRPRPPVLPVDPPAEPRRRRPRSDERPRPPQPRRPRSAARPPERRDRDRNRAQRSDGRPDATARTTGAPSARALRASRRPTTRPERTQPHARRPGVRTATSHPATDERCSSGDAPPGVAGALPRRRRRGVPRRAPHAAAPAHATRHPTAWEYDI